MELQTCPQCGEIFQYDPKRIWDSPGKALQLQKTPVVIQCPKCEQWIKVTPDLPDGNPAK